MSETIEHNGYTITIHQDEDAGHCGPRDDDGNFLWLGLPHRHYNIGDETIDMESITLPCHEDEMVAGEDHENCEVCYGEGTHKPRNLEELQEAITLQYDARLVVAVSMMDHSGVSYWLGGGASVFDPGGWDSGTCGFMVCTQAMLNEWGNPEWTDEEIRKSMAEEVKYYSQWASGDVWGYVITDVNGDEVDSCWGFIGYEWAIEAAKYSCPDAPVEELFTVRMTKAQWNRVTNAIGCTADETATTEVNIIKKTIK